MSIREWSIAMTSLLLAGFVAIVTFIAIRLYFHMNPFSIHINFIFSLGGIFFGLIVGFGSGIGSRVFKEASYDKFVVICMIFCIIFIILERFAFVTLALILSG